MKHILVIDDSPEKVKHLKELENENCSVDFAETFVEARRALKAKPDIYDVIYLDHDLDGRHTGVDLLKFLVYDGGIKKGCRIRPNSVSDKCNWKIKAMIVELGLSRSQNR